MAQSGVYEHQARRASVLHGKNIKDGEGLEDWDENQVDHTAPHVKDKYYTYTRKDYRSLEYLPKIGSKASEGGSWRGQIKGKRVTVFVNGDIIRHGIQMPLPKSINSWKLLLSSMTSALGQQIYQIYTPKGKRIRSLDGIRHGAVYVAAGTEPFKLLTYDGSNKGIDRKVDYVHTVTIALTTSQHYLFTMVLVVANDKANWFDLFALCSRTDANYYPTVDFGPKQAGYRKNETGYEERMDRLAHATKAIKIQVCTMDELAPLVTFLPGARDLLSWPTFLRRIGERIYLPHGNGTIHVVYNMYMEEVSIVCYSCLIFSTSTLIVVDIYLFS